VDLAFWGAGFAFVVVAVFALGLAFAVAGTAGGGADVCVVVAATRFGTTGGGLTASTLCADSEAMRAASDFGISAILKMLGACGSGAGLLLRA
jgi:hypothetical protein